MERREDKERIEIFRSMCNSGGSALRARRNKPSPLDHE
jgi:hypothetical protein